MKLSVKAFVDGEQSKIELILAGFQEGPDWDWYYEAVKVGWAEALKSLVKYLES